MYSIWVIPPEPVYSQIKTTIARLSSKYAGPLFEPHMTILGNIQADVAKVENACREVARQCDGLPLQLGPISFSTTYFQSVFVRIDSTARLMELHMALKAALGKQNDVFMPHMSLLYGEHDMAIREKAAAEVNLTAERFIATKLTITPATNNPDEWKHVSSIPFGKK